MQRKLLLSMLFIAFFIELALAMGAFFATEITMQKFGIPFNNDTLFPVYIIAWLLLFVSLVCALTIWLLVLNNPIYKMVCYLLGLWWIAIGIGIFVVFKKTDNLLLDSLKGLIIIILTVRCKGENPPSSVK